VDPSFSRLAGSRPTPPRQVSILLSWISLISPGRPPGLHGVHRVSTCCRGAPSHPTSRDAVRGRRGFNPLFAGSPSSAPARRPTTAPARLFQSLGVERLITSSTTTSGGTSCSILLRDLPSSGAQSVEPNTRRMFQSLLAWISLSAFIGRSGAAGVDCLPGNPGVGSPHQPAGSGVLWPARKPFNPVVVIARISRPMHANSMPNRSAIRVGWISPSSADWSTHPRGGPERVAKPCFVELPHQPAAGTASGFSAVRVSSRVSWDLPHQPRTLALLLHCSPLMVFILVVCDLPRSADNASLTTQAVTTFQSSDSLISLD